MISPAARMALEIWCERHPEATRIPDPYQIPLDLRTRDTAAQMPRGMNAEPGRYETGNTGETR